MFLSSLKYKWDLLAKPQCFLGNTIHLCFRHKINPFYCIFHPLFHCPSLHPTHPPTYQIVSLATTQNPSTRLFYLISSVHVTCVFKSAASNGAFSSGSEPWSLRCHDPEGIARFLGRRHNRPCAYITLDTRGIIKDNPLAVQFRLSTISISMK